MLPRLKPLPTMQWVREAKCRGLDPNMFFPPLVESESDAHRHVIQRWEGTEARKVCAECPVRRECFEFALATRQEDGVWGGRVFRRRRRRLVRSWEVVA